MPWFEYQVQVTDEAGAIVSELPLTDVVDQMAGESARVKAEPDVSSRAQLLDEASEPLEQDRSPDVAGLSGRKDLDVVMSSLSLALEEVAQSQAPVQGQAGQSNEPRQAYRLRATGAD